MPLPINRSFPPSFQWEFRLSSRIFFSSQLVLFVLSSFSSQGGVFLSSLAHSEFSSVPTRRGVLVECCELGVSISQSRSPHSRSLAGSRDPGVSLVVHLILPIPLNPRFIISFSSQVPHSRSEPLPVETTEEVIHLPPSVETPIPSDLATQSSPQNPPQATLKTPLGLCLARGCRLS